MEAKLEKKGEGLSPQGDGWFIVNVKDVRWQENPRFGRWCELEGEERFPHLGINIHMLEPGQPACHYHGESAQEGFLVLRGECLLIVEGEERRMGPWDFFHCAPHTRHVFVGAGQGPCAILMVGARQEQMSVLYPVDETALKHHAGVRKETTSPKESYAGSPESRAIPAPWPLED